MTVEREGSITVARGSGRTPVILLAVAAAVPAAVPALIGAIPAHRDLLVFFLPMKIFLGRRLLAGDLPLWDPFTENGAPFMANLQSQVFYLPNLLTSVLPLAWSYGAYTAFHMVMAALGMYAWARLYRVSRSAAMVAGLAYALGGPVVAAIEFSSIMGVAPWIPWSCWAAIRFARRPRPATLIAYVLAVAGLGLGGEPHTALGGAIMAFLFGWLSPIPAADAPAASDSHAEDPGVWQRALLLAGGGVLAVALIGVQVLPFAELLSLSDRTGGLPLELSAMHSVGIADLSGLLAPEPDAFELGAGGRGQIYMPLQYQGVLILAALLATALSWTHIASSQRRTIAVAAAVFVGGWLIAAGDNLPLFPLLHGSGLMASMRYPVKFILPVSAALALLAAHGVDRIQNTGKAVAAGMVLFAVACGVSFATSGDRGWLHAALFATLIGLSLAARRASPQLLAAALAVDLLLAHALIHPALPAADLLADFEAARTVRQAEGRVYTRPYTRADMERDAASATSGDVFPLSRMRVLGLMGNLPMALGVRTTRGGPALRLANQARILELMDRGPAGIDSIRIAGASYFLSREPLSNALLQPVAGPTPPFLFRLDGALPRQYLSCSWRRGGLEDAWQSPTVIAGTEVYIGADEAALLPPSRASPPPIPADAVTTRYDEPDRRTFAVRAPADCVLVLAESSYPGWTARVHGDPAPVITVNGSWVGVPVPPGEYLVDLEFRPRSMRRGAMISLAALLILAFWARRLRRPESSPG